MATSNTSKWILSSVTVVVILGIIALSTGAQKPPQTPSAKMPATAQSQPATTVVKAETIPSVTPVTTPTPAVQPANVKVAATKAGATTTTAPTAATDKTSPTPEEVASYLEAYGWMVGQQAGFEMGFTPAEKDAIMKGLDRAASGGKAPEKMKEMFPKMQEYLSAKEKAYRAAAMAKMAEEAKVHVAEGEKFLADVAKQPDVKKSASGLYYKIEAAGNDKKPTADDVVTIHYTGKLVDGTVFDSSVERGVPVDLPLYGVIPGFSEGLQMLGEGGKATLYIPSDLGYGNQAAGPIPPGSTLIFTVELIKVQPKPAAPAADAKAPEAMKDAPKEAAPVATPAAPVSVTDSKVTEPAKEDEAKEAAPASDAATDEEKAASAPAEPADAPAKE